MAEDVVRVGFVGCGRVAANHFRAVKNCHFAELKAVSDTDEGRARARAAEWKAASLPLEEIVSSPDIDALFVLTPYEYHYTYARAALMNGKHVLVEKPVSFDSREIRHLIELSRKAGKLCMPGHSYIYLPELARAAGLVSRGEIGSPRWMFFSEVYVMPQELAQLYHGPTGEVLWHAAYLMVAYLGVPARVQAFSSLKADGPHPADQQVTVNAAFASGALCQVFISWAVEDESSDPWTFKLKLLGADGSVHFSRRDVVTGPREPNLPRDYPLYDEMFEREVVYFVDECIRQKKEPLSTLEDALATLRIVDSIRLSIAEERVVPLETSAS